MLGKDVPPAVMFAGVAVGLQFVAKYTTSEAVTAMATTAITEVPLHVRSCSVVRDLTCVSEYVILEHFNGAHMLRSLVCPVRDHRLAFT